MGDRLDFLSYKWQLFAISTTTIILLLIVHSLVLLFTTRSFKKDNRTYMILIKAYSIMALVGSVIGYSGGLRRETILPYYIYIPYGPGRYLFQARLVAVIDSFTTQMVPAGPMLLATMMVFRAMIMFNKRLRKRTVYIVLTVIFVGCLPLNVWLMKNYVPLDEVHFVNVSEALLQEFKLAPAYAVYLDDLGNILWMLGSGSPLVSITVGFIALLCMTWKLHIIRKVIAKGTRKLHAAFMMLLTLDLLIIVCYSLVMTLAFNGISQKMADFMNMFTFPIFAVPIVVQGIMSLLFVPYLRASLIAMIRGKKTTEATENSHKMVTVSAVKSSH